MSDLNFFLPHLYNEDTHQFDIALYTNIAENVLMNVTDEETVKDVINELRIDVDNKADLDENGKIKTEQLPEILNMEISISDYISEKSDNDLITDEHGKLYVPSLETQFTTIEIGTVTIVEQGEPADVVNVGTPQNAIFNFKFPQGEPATINGFNDIEIVNGQNTTVEMDGNKLWIDVAGGGDGTSPEWGNITGEITNQLDLINYVDDIVGDIGAVLDGINRAVI